MDERSKIEQAITEAWNAAAPCEREDILLNIANTVHLLIRATNRKDKPHRSKERAQKVANVVHRLWENVCSLVANDGVPAFVEVNIIGTAAELDRLLAAQVTEDEAELRRALAAEGGGK